MLAPVRSCCTGLQKGNAQAVAATVNLADTLEGSQLAALDTSLICSLRDALTDCTQSERDSGMPGCDGLPQLPWNAGIRHVRCGLHDSVGLTWRRNVASSGTDESFASCIIVSMPVPEFCEQSLEAASNAGCRRATGPGLSMQQSSAEGLETCLSGRPEATASGVARRGGNGRQTGIHLERHRGELPVPRRSGLRQLQ